MVKLGIWHELVPVVVEVAEVVSVVVIVVAAAANPATTVKKSGIYLETVQKNDQVVAVILQAVPVTTVVGQGICLESALIEAAGAVAEEEPLKLATGECIRMKLLIHLHCIAYCLMSPINPLDHSFRAKYHGISLILIHRSLVLTSV